MHVPRSDRYPLVYLGLYDGKNYNFYTVAKRFPRHGVITPLTFKHRATIEKFNVEKPIITFCPT